MGKIVRHGHTATHAMPFAIDFGRLRKAVSGFPIISCDIFDTAVMRRLARPEDALLATGARALSRGLTSCRPEAFMEHRLEAERSARQAALAEGHDEVRIADIYARIQACGLTHDGEKLAQLEFAVEQSICQPIKSVRQLLTECGSDQRVIFLSDTMLPGAWLTTLLADCGYGDSCVVFSSADVRKSKHTGRLFDHVVEALGCSPAHIIHVGDNPVTDIARAAEHGLRTLHLPWRSAPPEEDRVAKADWPVRLVHSHRRSRAEQTLRDAPPAPVLYRYLSMLLVGFSLFTLAEARRRNIHRIYFLSRDGYLPLAIAKRLIGHTGENLELNYIYASRQSIVVPAMIDDVPKLADDIFHSMLGRPLNTAFEFIGIGAEDASPLIRDAGLDPGSSSGGSSGAEAIRKLFLKHRDVIIDGLEKRRATALAYLDQSGFLKPGPRLIVDVGWRGSTQTALAKLTGLPPADIAGSYLGLLPQALRPGLEPHTASGYLFSFGHPRPIMNKVLEGYALFELFLSAPHGSTLHYALKDGCAHPVLATEEEPGATKRGEAFAAIEAGCLREFEAMHAILDGSWPDSINPESALFDFEGLLTHPTVQEVAMINAIPFIAGINSSRNTVAASRVPLREFLLNLNHAIKRLENSPWRSGSVRVSTPWPIPSMSFQDFRYRISRLRHLLSRN